jgi:hypothetical protein
MTHAAHALAARDSSFRNRLVPKNIQKPKEIVSLRSSSLGKHGKTIKRMEIRGGHRPLAGPRGPVDPAIIPNKKHHARAVNLVQRKRRAISDRPATVKGTAMQRFKTKFADKLSAAVAYVYDAFLPVGSEGFVWLILWGVVLGVPLICVIGWLIQGES